MRPHFTFPQYDENILWYIEIKVSSTYEMLPCMDAFLNENLMYWTLKIWNLTLTNKDIYWVYNFWTTIYFDPLEYSKSILEIFYNAICEYFSI